MGIGIFSRKKDSSKKKQISIVSNDKKTEGGIFKIIIMGNVGVGKTSLFLRFCGHNKFYETPPPDVETDRKELIFPYNGKDVKVRLWDTAGQEKFHTMTNAFFRGANGVIMVYDITNAQSLVDSDNWFNEIESVVGMNNMAKILIGNKSDDETNRVVSREKAQELATKYNAAFEESSAKDNKNCDFQAIFAKMKY